MCAYIGRKAFNLNGICKLCGRLEESRVHIILNCEVTHSTISYFNHILRRFHNENLTERDKIFGLISEDILEKRLFNYLLDTIRHIIFRKRNTEYVDVRSAIMAITRKVIFEIKKDLEMKFSIKKYQNNIQHFRNTYLINNILGKIENGLLIITI